jgi:hypothetical protein
MVKEHHSFSKINRMFQNAPLSNVQARYSLGQGLGAISATACHAEKPAMTPLPSSMVRSVQSPGPARYRHVAYNRMLSKYLRHDGQLDYTAVTIRDG